MQPSLETLLESRFPYKKLFYSRGTCWHWGPWQVTQGRVLMLENTSSFKFGSRILKSQLFILTLPLSCQFAGL